MEVMDQCMISIDGRAGFVAWGQLFVFLVFRSGIVGTTDKIFPPTLVLLCFVSLFLEFS